MSARTSHKPASRPHARHAPPPREAAAPALPAAPAEAGERAAGVLWAALALFVLARAALTFAPNMWAWGLNVGRFTSPAFAWLPWLASALALVPAIARALEPPARALGRAIERSPVASGVVAALAGGALAAAFPDQVRYVGDFLLRQGSIEQAAKPAAIYPQALPLDVWLHFTLPSAMTAHGWASANGAARLLGAVEAGALAALACAFARALAPGGAATLAVACAVFFGGWLGLFTGYAKSFAELVLVVTAVAAYGVRAVREGRGLLALGLAVAAGVLLHRGMLALLPAAVLAWALAIRAHGAALLRRPVNVVALALPLVTLAAMAPRLVRLITSTDSVHFASAEVMNAGGPLAAAFAGARPADLADLVALMAPLAWPALAAALVLLARVPRRGELALLVLLALAFAGPTLFLHPVQGWFRDWDDFGAPAAALGALAAWIAAETLRAAPKRAWLAVTIALAVAMPSVQWLAHHRDVERGLARAHAFMDEPPARTPSERARTFDWIGIRAYDLGRWPEASTAFREASVTAPSPRMLQQWAIAATRANDLLTAREAYHRLLEKDPRSTSGWLGLAAVESRIPDFDASRGALRTLMSIAPADSQPVRLLQLVDELERQARARAAAGSAAPPAPTLR